nr:sigma-70 family RNA polymerase sigma factor [Caulobacter mirabilis]
MGDEEVFKRELVRLVPDLTGWARYLTKGADDVGDLVQDTIVNALKYRDRFEPGSNLKAWTFRILRNRFLSQRRSARRTDPLEPEMEAMLATVDDRQSAFDLDDARRALDAMTEERRQLLLLVGVAGVSYEDLAAAAGCPLGTVKSRVARARQELRGALAGRPPRDDMPAHQAVAVITRDAEIVRRRWVEGRRAA